MDLDDVCKRYNSGQISATACAQDLIVLCKQLEAELHEYEISQFVISNKELSRENKQLEESCTESDKAVEALMKEAERLEDDNRRLKGIWDKAEDLCPQCGTANPKLKQLEDALRKVKKITTSALKQMGEEEDFYWVKEMSEIDMIAQKVLDGK